MHVIVTFLLLLSVNAYASSVATPTDVSIVSADDAGAMVQAAASAADHGQWAIVVGFGIMLAVWGIKKAMPSISAKFVPWIAMGSSMAVYIANNLMQSGDWKKSVVHGFMAGASAVGLWELVFQHVMVDKEPT